MKHMVSMRWVANPNQSCSQFPHNLWSLYAYLIHYQGEDSCVHEMVIWISSIMLISKPRMVNIF